MDKKYTKEELLKIHEIQIRIMREVIRICEINNINYFTVGGTTLGAVRHSGFIPWDDDIDIGMIRKDYDRFLEVASKQIDPQYYILNHSTEKEFPSYFTKICKRGTSFIEYDTRKLKYTRGVFVDIFPFDNLPNGEKRRERFCKKINILNQLFKSKLLFTISGASTSKNKGLARIIRFTLHILLIPVPRSLLYRKLTSAMKRFDKEDCEFVSSAGNKYLVTEKKDVFPTITHKFETLMVQIPLNYQKILANQYGDYMKLPPEGKRLSHYPYYMDLGK